MMMAEKKKKKKKERRKGEEENWEDYEKYKKLTILLYLLENVEMKYQTCASTEISRLAPDLPWPCRKEIRIIKSE